MDCSRELLATFFPKNGSIAIGKTFPNQTVIRVKDAINAFNDVFTKVMTAIRMAGSITLLAGALVLAGAFATAQRRRNLEAVILKTLGATRGNGKKPDAENGKSANAGRAARIAAGKT